MNTEEQRAARIAHGKRANARAKQVLKPGDIIQYTMCAGLRGRAKFKGWDGNWIETSTKNDIHALHIFKVNGTVTSFRDDGEDPRGPTL